MAAPTRDELDILAPSLDGPSSHRLEPTAYPRGRPRNGGSSRESSLASSKQVRQRADGLVGNVPPPRPVQTGKATVRGREKPRAVGARGCDVERMTRLELATS